MLGHSGEDVLGFFKQVRHKQVGEERWFIYTNQLPLFLIRTIVSFIIIPIKEDQGQYYYKENELQS